jgi:hypothetical protein
LIDLEGTVYRAINDLNIFHISTADIPAEGL